MAAPDIAVVIVEMMGGSPRPVRTLAQMDRPDHIEYRRLAQAAVQPRDLREIEPRIGEIARVRGTVGLRP